MNENRRIAYFSMEIGTHLDVPTYAGGLGILAGDTVRAAADLKVPMVAVTLLHRKSYFLQKLDASGWQTEEPMPWNVDAILTDTRAQVRVCIEGRTVHLRAWRYNVRGASDFVVPVYLLDTDLPEYDMRMAGRMTAGVDLWLNTPQPPLEASESSGMKAAVNGVPSLSILDGWWIEGCVDGITGWAIGSDGQSDDEYSDAASLYRQLQDTIVPMFYDQRGAFIDVMRHTIALNGSFFNTHRMVHQYAQKAYL